MATVLAVLKDLKTGYLPNVSTREKIGQEKTFLQDQTLKCISITMLCKLLCYDL